MSLTNHHENNHFGYISYQRYEDTDDTKIDYGRNKMVTNYLSSNNQFYLYLYYDGANCD